MTCQEDKVRVSVRVPAPVEEAEEAAAEVVVWEVVSGAVLAGIVSALVVVKRLSISRGCPVIP